MCRATAKSVSARCSNACRERVGSVAAERFVKAVRNAGLLIEGKVGAIEDKENSDE
jgi:hypothetical protein